MAKGAGKPGARMQPRSAPHLPPSCHAHAGHPVRRGSSIQSIDGSGILDRPPLRTMTECGVVHAMTHMQNRSAARTAPEILPEPFALCKQRARGMPGAQCTRSLARAGVVKYARKYSQRRHRKHPAFPTQWFDDLYVVSPEPGFFAPVTCATRWRRRKLGISVGMPGPHDFVVRHEHVRLPWPQRPSHPRLAFRDDWP
jgi:hypothetical protein